MSSALPLILIPTSDWEGRWKMFDNLSRRFFAAMSGQEEFALDPTEWKQFNYLRLVLAEDYRLKKEKPWLRGTGGIF